MIRDVVDRFRYRFQLWRRERREDYLGPDEPAAPIEPIKRDYISHFSDHPELVTESTFASIGRRTAFLGIISIAAYIGFWICRFCPALRFTVGVAFLAFCCLWIVGVVLFEVDLRRARKQYRERETKKSSNQAMQRTAGRSAF